MDGTAISFRIGSISAPIADMEYPNTFIATVEAISFVGARPVFVEVDPNTYTIDPVNIESAITSRTKVVLPVHLYGQPADMEAILEVAGKHNLLIIEDARQAHGAYCRIKGEWVRTGAIGHVGCFSFYPGKNLGCYGEGGAAVTRDPDIAEKMQRIRDHGSKEKYYHIYKGLNLRMENLQGAVLLAKLPYLDLWNQKRRENARVYGELFGNMGEIVRPSEAGERSVPVIPHGGDRRGSKPHTEASVAPANTLPPAYAGAPPFCASHAYHTPVHFLHFVLIPISYSTYL